MSQASGPPPTRPQPAAGEKDLSVCHRLERLREEQFGPRGKSEMARRLAIRPSTYDRYERDRVPPADLLVKIADVADVTLEWLLTGEGPKRPAVQADREAEALTRQFQEAITVRPGLRPGVTRLLDWLETLPQEAERVRSGKPDGGKPGGGDARGSGDAGLDEAGPDDAGPDDAGPGGRGPSSGGSGGGDSGSPAGPAGNLVPVIGSTSAGLARRWDEMDDSFGGEEADRRIEEILAETSPDAGPRPVPIQGEADDRPSDGEVSLVQRSNPDASGVVEFLDAAAVRRSYPDAVAWRVDGDSMEPRYHDGDLVITSRSVPAEVGQPCVARQKGQIGVNCKVFQTDGEQILLIPANPRHEVQRLQPDDLHWACRVLAVVRLEPGR